jgi:RNA polymerase sigma-70 factor (ECF subfamily)
VTERLPPPREDRDRAERIRRGDAGAFEALFREHHAGLCRFAEGYVRDSAIAEELVQDVFFELWRGRAGWELRATVRAYLFGAVRNRALNHLKRASRERGWLARLGREADPSDPSPAPDRAAAESEAAAAVARAVSRLPERARMVVELRWRHGLRHGEIAEVMGISVKGVENQLGRALKALRATLGDFHD